MNQYIGEILIDYEKIFPEQLEVALEIQKDDGNSLGDILIKLDFIDEETLRKYLVKQGATVEEKRRFHNHLGLMSKRKKSVLRTKMRTISKA